MADYYHELSIKEDSILESKADIVYNSYKKGDLVWKTKNSEKILVKNMAENHLRNSIIFLKKKHYSNSYIDPYVSAIIDVLEMELKNRFK